MRILPSSPDLPSVSHGYSIGQGLSGHGKRGIEEADPELTQEENSSANKRHKASSTEGQADNVSDTTVSGEWFGTEPADDTDNGHEDDDDIVDALLERWTVVAVISQV